MIHLGASGFSYDDWRGGWYPPDLPKAAMFDYYARRFNAVEINSTFYHLPSPRLMESLVRRAAGRVMFAAKLPREFTHCDPPRVELAADFKRAMEPARAEGKLGALLLQYPFRFHDSPENRAALEIVAGAFEGWPLVVEIRHASWQAEPGMEFFRERALSLCVVDMPRLKNLPETKVELTGPIAYVRLHGRNGREWFHSDEVMGGYDYNYSPEELGEWIEPIRRLERKAESAFVFFNNHVRGQAPRNAEVLRELLGEPPAPPGYRDLFS